MSRKAYRLEEGSIQDGFDKSRAKIQIFGGGFGNGKTTALAMKALKVAKDYPGSNSLLARSTYPKLNDTLRRVVLQWTPREWIKQFSKTDNDLTFINGSEIHFRYISQRSGGGESGTSNLLSATYDFIGVDQVEDPEIVEKDFDDLLGRLRGDTPYRGDDPTMPQSGPRWMCLCLNPTRNWVYRKLVRPYQEWKRTGYKPDDLLIDVNTGECLFELFEGSTYTNASNLPKDFIATLESAYRGQMRERFLMGEWAAYEGLVYPEFDAVEHMVKHEDVVRLLRRLRSLGYQVEPIAGYDYGLAVPSCFLLGFADHNGNVFFLDGFYEKEVTIEKQAERIRRLFMEYGFDYHQARIYADPAIFRRSAGDKATVGKSIAAMFQECGLFMLRGNNDVLNGIQKVKAYLSLTVFHKHPLKKAEAAPHLFFSNRLSFVENEIGDYYWRKDTQDDLVDKPQDKNDHAMDTLKYALSDEPELAQFIGDPNEPKTWMTWHEFEPQQDQKRKARYA